MARAILYQKVVVCVPHWQQKSKKYRVTYPRLYGEVHLDVIIDKLADAKSSSETADGSRKFLICQFREAYRKKYKKEPHFMYWSDLRFHAVPVAAPTAASSGDNRYCCRSDTCPVCDTGNHGWCRRGCTL